MAAPSRRGIFRCWRGRIWTGKLKLDEMISARIGLEAINDGFAALKRGETVRSVVMFA